MTKFTVSALKPYCPVRGVPSLASLHLPIGQVFIYLYGLEEGDDEGCMESLTVIL